ncbi:uncharacterized protein LOC143316300 [Chaetodon auriga]|uniref:uncharacterized protein LOC143316300 n=1 Tax=Chaetodon auriga TaxID=39042 RepID=UPI004032E306
MNRCEDREEGVRPSKTSLCGDDDGQTEAQRPEQQDPPDSAGPGPGPGPGPSCVSFRSDRSMDRLFHFKQQHISDRQIYGRPASDGPGPGPSCVSLKSERSTGRLIDYKGDRPHRSPALSSGAQRHFLTTVKPQQRSWRPSILTVTSAEVSSGGVWKLRS